MTVLYRKWRPKKFRSVVGQRPIIRTLRNAVSSEKVAHAYLFSGPRGTGKTTTGRLLAKAINCESPSDGDVCNRCSPCRSFLKGTAVDLIEMDAASNRGIEEARRLRDQVNFAPMFSHKVYLIDEAHMLTPQAFNALLKTLEEPPRHVTFVLATTEPEKIPSTIASRCQRFDFKRVDSTTTAKRLRHVAGREHINLSKKVALVIASEARGSVRDALSLLDQVIDLYGRAPSMLQVRECFGIVEDPRATLLAKHAISGELREGLGVISEVYNGGMDMRQFRQQVIRRLQSILHAGPDNYDEVALAFRFFGNAADDASLPTLPLELALAQICLAQRGEKRRVQISVPAVDDIHVSQKKVENAAHVVQEYITRCGYAEAFRIAQEIGIGQELTWEQVDDDTDRLTISLKDLQLVAFAAAIRTQKAGKRGKKHKKSRP